jgi:integrase
MPVYAERRDGRLTGVQIGEVTIKGKRTRERFETHAAAMRWCQMSKLLERPAPVEGKTDGALPAGMRFDMAARKARAERAEWKHSKDTSLDQRLETVVALIGPAVPVHEVPPKLHQFVSTLELRRGRDGGPLSTKTVNRYLAVVSAILSHHNVAATIPWQEEASGRMHFLHREQADAVTPHMAAKGEEFALTLRVLIATAMRPGEFWNIEPGQIEDKWVRLWKTKTNYPRSIPITPALARQFRRMVEESRVPDEAAFYRAFKAACEACGLPKELTTYSLRHTGLTWLVADGMSGPLAQKWGGHRDYRTTQNYVHLFDETLADFHEKAGTFELKAVRAR